MKHLYFISIFILLSFLTEAQSHVKNVYAELGAPGFLSANYDMRLSDSNKGLGFRVGVGTIFDVYTFGVTVPVGINYLIGMEKHFLELGAGVSYVYLPRVNQDQPFNFRKESFLASYVFAGYRYQPSQKKFTFRAGLCKLFNDINIPAVLGISNLLPSVSFGYSLR